MTELSGRVALLTDASGGIAMLRNGYITNKVVTLDGGLLPR